MPRSVMRSATWSTVRNHVQHVYRKFGVHSKEELVARVAEEE